MNSSERQREMELIRNARTRGVDFWTDKIIYPFSYRLVFAIRDKAITPNQLTLAGLLTGIASAVLIGLPMRPLNILGSLGIQVAFCFDCADGQLARYRKMESAFGRWLDDMSGVVLFCSYIGAAALNYRARFHENSVVIWALFSLFVTAFYTLHREIRPRAIAARRAQTSSPINGVSGLLFKARSIKPNLLLLLSIGLLLDLPKPTIVVLTVYQVVLFLLSVSYLLATELHSRALDSDSLDRPRKRLNGNPTSGNLP